jgi:spermidine synthase
MTRPWQILASTPTDEGLLELRRRGDRDFILVVGGRVLMTSVHHRSEDRLATLACAELAGIAAPRVLVGGLGMGFTLRAALDALPAGARVVVVERSAPVAAWCRGPLAGLTGDAVSDPRVEVRIADVAQVIADARPAAHDAILLDLYEGPNASSQRRDDPFYGAAALALTRAALAPGGILAVWSEDPDVAFERRLQAAGFAVSVHRVGHGGRVHLVYLGRLGRRAAPTASTTR